MAFLSFSFLSSLSCFPLTLPKLRLPQFYCSVKEKRSGDAEMSKTKLINYSVSEDDYILSKRKELDIEGMAASTHFMQKLFPNVLRNSKMKI
jgi:hypothetical protein